jgi:hypothetical protein
MINLADEPDVPLTAGRLDVSMRGSILVGGKLLDAETIKTAGRSAPRSGHGEYLPFSDSAGSGNAISDSGD